MKNNPLYRQLEQIALDKDRPELSTSAKAKAMTIEQAKGFVGDVTISSVFYDNMKRLLVNTLEYEEKKAKLLFLKNTLSKTNFDFLKTEYPRFAIQLAEAVDG